MPTDAAFMDGIDIMFTGNCRIGGGTLLFKNT
jgi:hypothetical protein